MWKFRCDAVKGREMDTMEIRIKRREKQLMDRLRERPWLLLQEDQYLLRAEPVFKHGEIKSITNWEIRVEQSMLENMHRKEKFQDDIRKYLCYTLSCPANKSGIGQHHLYAHCVKKTDETISHVFQCTYDLVKSNRAKLLSQMKTSFTKYKTSPLLINHIMRMLYQYCGGHQVTKINTPRVAIQSPLLRKVSQAVNIQIDDIGIQNMLLGIATPAFVESQRLYLQNNSFGNLYNADRWGRWFLHEMLELSTQLWKYRCTLVHERKEGSMEHRLRCLAVDWLVQLRQNQTLIPITARHLLNRSSKYFMSGPIRSVNAWIRKIEVELEQKQLPTRLPDIREWLKPIPATTSNIECYIIGEKVDDASSISTDPDPETILSVDSMSCNAMCDLLLDTDTIPTFPHFKHETSTDQHNQALYPVNVIVSRVENTDDRYENIQRKKKLQKQHDSRYG